MKYFILISFLFSCNLFASELIQAVKKANLSEVEKLIKQGADPHAKDHSSKTPLHYASIYGYLEIAKLLIKQGVDVNQKDQNGNTPLHLSVMHMHSAVLELLLHNEASVHVTNHRGQNVFDIFSSTKRSLSSESPRVSFKKIPDPFNLWKKELKKALKGLIF